MRERVAHPQSRHGHPDLTLLLRAYIAECGPVLYHLTDAVNLAAILRDGLRPSGSDSQYDDRTVLSPGHVYLCNERVARDTLADHLADWGDAAITVDLRRLDARRLRDEDYWRGELSDEGHTHLPSAAVKRLRPDMDRIDVVLSALRGGGTCSYAGIIPPAALQVAFVPKRPDLDLESALRALFAGPHYGRGLTSPDALKRIDLADARWLDAQRARLST